jgi:hypothetical protein
VNELLEQLAEALQKASPSLEIDTDGWLRISDTERDLTVSCADYMPDWSNGEFIVWTLDLLEEWGWWPSLKPKDETGKYRLYMSNANSASPCWDEGDTRAEVVAKALLHAAKARLSEPAEAPGLDHLPEANHG